MKAIITLFSALALTLAIEVPLGAVLIKRKDSVIPLTLINVLTNPALNALLTVIFWLTQSHTVYYITVVIGEIAVFIGEGFLIRALCGIQLKRSIIISTITNAASLILGSAILALI
ncbi:MAG: hypothetical protein IJF21_01390 [Clostridia bacterium]|nr:hypothetical protein [Clostridia bacterium]